MTISECDKKIKLPRNDIFTKLRDLWILRNPTKNSKDLARLLQINPSNLSAYCSISNEKLRLCPDWCILYLLKELDVKVTISTDLIEITSVESIGNNYVR